MNLQKKNDPVRERLVRRLVRLPLRIRQLLQIMSIREVLRVALTPKTAEEVTVHLSRSGHDVVFRRGTSDITCLEKVFRTQEYKTPFPTDAKVIVDAGANIGAATLYYSHMYPNAKIVAIEPESSNYEILARNCGDLPNVTLIKGALWSQEGRLEIQNPNGEKWEYTVAEVRSPTEPGSEEIRAVTVPGIMKALCVDHIDLLKVDIEGAECELFNSGAHEWIGAVGQIVIELHDWLRPGCAWGFYSAVCHRPFIQETRGENVFIKFEDEIAS
jgi:FkbM family methyltransferase